MTELVTGVGNILLSQAACELYLSFRAPQVLVNRFSDFLDSGCDFTTNLTTAIRILYFMSKDKARSNKSNRNVSTKDVHAIRAFRSLTGKQPRLLSEGELAPKTLGGR